MSFTTRITTFNILHPDHLDRFKDAHGRVDHARVAKWSDWDARQNRILSQMSTCDSQIYCLQDAPSNSEGQGLYKGIFSKNVGMYSYFHNGQAGQILTTSNTEYQWLQNHKEHFDYVENGVSKSRVFTVRDLRHRATQKVIRVANCHLLADETQATKQMEQILKCVENNAGNIFATIIAGSFSADIDSPSRNDARFKLLQDHNFEFRPCTPTEYTEAKPIKEMVSDLIWIKSQNPFVLHLAPIRYASGESDVSNHHPQTVDILFLGGLEKKAYDHFEQELVLAGKDRSFINLQLGFFRAALYECQGTFQTELERICKQKIESQDIYDDVDPADIALSIAALQRAINSTLNPTVVSTITAPPAPVAPPTVTSPAANVTVPDPVPTPSPQPQTTAPKKKTGFCASILAGIARIWSAFVSCIRRLFSF